MTRYSDDYEHKAVRHIDNSPLTFLHISQNNLERSSVEDRRVLDNIKLVSHFVKKAVKLATVTKDDMFQGGLEGLIRASHGFKPEVGVKFSSYASVAIMRGIRRAVYESAQPFILTYKATRKIFTLNKKVAEYIDKYNREPSIAEMAELIHADFDTTYILYGMSQEMSSSEQGKVTKELMNSYMTENDQYKNDYDEFFMLHKYLGTVYDIIEILPVLEGAIILLRTGLYDGNGYTTAEVGYILSIPPGLVRDIEFHAINHIRSIPMSTVFKRDFKSISVWDFIEARVYESQRNLLTEAKKGHNIYNMDSEFGDLFLMSGSPEELDDEVDDKIVTDKLDPSNKPQRKLRVKKGRVDNVE